MEKTTSAPLVTAYANEQLEKSSILDNPYFQALKSGTMSLEAFRKSQEQFLFAVSFFPRPMAALVGRIPDARARLDILRNLVEEHGEFQEEAFHSTTFQQFLVSVGKEPKETDDLIIQPGVRAFNSVLTCACLLDELEVGVGCMGIIEHAFARISALIGQAVVGHGWVEKHNLKHYQLHAKIDERHAEEFFAVIEPQWKNPARQYFIKQGIGLGLHIFDRLYKDLCEIAQQT